jgi:hypothetical protein
MAELGKLSRFSNPRELMGYSGLVSSEYSSDNRIQRGSITKTGNAHLRRVIVEAAWAYQHKPWIGGWLAKRRQGLDEEKSDRMEGSVATVCAIQKLAAKRKKQTADCDRHWPRTPGLHLGHRCPHRRHTANGAESSIAKSMPAIPPLRWSRIAATPQGCPTAPGNSLALAAARP